MIPSKFCINPGESLDFFLEDERQTHALGRVLADRLKSGDIVYLKGEMGVASSYALLIEWPERLAHLGFDHHLEIVLKEAGAVQRTVSIRCHGNFRLG